MWVGTRDLNLKLFKFGSIKGHLPEFYGCDWVSETDWSFCFDPVKDPSWCKSHLHEGDVNIFTGVFPCGIKQQKLALSFGLVLTTILF